MCSASVCIWWSLLKTTQHPAKKLLCSELPVVSIPLWHIPLLNSFLSYNLYHEIENQVILIVAFAFTDVTLAGMFFVAVFCFCFFPVLCLAGFCKLSRPHFRYHLPQIGHHVLNSKTLFNFPHKCYQWENTELTLLLYLA